MSSQPPLSPPASQPKTFSQVLGEVTWLLSQSPAHRHLFISDLEWLVMPPLLLEQFRLFAGPDGRPAALALWAQLTPECVQRLEAGSGRLQPQDWNAGSEPWLVELIAPFGGEAEALADCHRTVFNGRPFRFHQQTAAGRQASTYPAADAH